MYNSVSEVIREVLRRDALQAMKLEALRKDIHQGMASGPVIANEEDHTKRAEKIGGKY